MGLSPASALATIESIWNTMNTFIKSKSGSLTVCLNHTQEVMVVVAAPSDKKGGEPDRSKSEGKKRATEAVDGPFHIRHHSFLGDLLADLGVVHRHVWEGARSGRQGIGHNHRGCVLQSVPDGRRLAGLLGDVACHLRPRGLYEGSGHRSAAPGRRRLGGVVSDGAGEHGPRLGRHAPLHQDVSRQYCSVVL